MATFIVTANTIPLEGFGNGSQGSTVIRAATESEARTQGAAALGVPEHDVSVTNMNEVPL